MLSGKREEGSEKGRNEKTKGEREGGGGVVREGGRRENEV